MARTQTLVQLSDELVQLLDARAARCGVSRSAVVREAVEAYLHDEGTEAAGRRIVDGYTRVPPGTPDAWGNVEAWHDALAAARAQEAADGQW